ncbi:bifunctional diguanylate cyclase/phosphodiesterase [Actinoplanes sp. TFC3]|uniref:putative bifunctional diguanylate cyclase/phosphodiesterase n=1 Tax=Actinoplanes sp. TFC3 TaxID=1710355 RepID=UPI000833207B|nr:EAL domain-containing protein [Actinoplanes sp. TFC3]
MDRQGQDESHRFRWRVLRRDRVLQGIVLWSLLIVLLFVLLRPAARQVEIFWVAQIPLDMLLAWFSWRVHLQASGATRRFWGVLAGSASLFVIGDVTQSALSFAAPATASTAGGVVQSGCLLAGQLVVTVTMLMHPDASRSARAKLALWLDAATVLAGGAAVSWCFAVAPVQAGSSEFAGRAVVAVMTVVATFAAVRIALSGNAPLHRIAATPMVISVLLASATAFLPSAATNGAAVTVLVVQFLTSPLIASGPRLQYLLLRTDLKPFGVHRRRAYSLLPYGAVLVTFITLAAVLPADSDARLYGAAAGTVAVTALVVARQLLAFQDNARLINQMREQEKLLSRQASLDGLTDLANRTSFTDQVARALAEGSEITLLLIDLDNFKMVNDTMGHAAGDALLVGVAECLRRAVRADDVVARLGGDEFAVLLRRASAQRSQATAERIIASVTEYVRPGHDATVGASVGIASAGPDDDVESLISAADIAMYAAKARGRGTQVAYTPDLRAKLQQRSDLTVRLAQAIADGRIFVVYQPIVRLDDGGLVAVEALARWQSEAGAVIPPGDFIAVAEDSGLIVELGRSVLHTACAQAAAWRVRHPAHDLLLTVNVTGRQLRDPGFIAEVTAVLHDTGLPADRLGIEITETAVVDNDIALQTLHGLRRLGIRLALDDFGTAASSLSLLLTCPITAIKLDRSFVESVVSVDRQEAVARAVSQIAETMHLTAVAEGIETVDQAAALRGMGYRIGQGFLFSRPVPAEEIERKFLMLQAETCGPIAARAAD